MNQKVDDHYNDCADESFCGEIPMAIGLFWQRDGTFIEHFLTSSWHRWRMLRTQRRWRRGSHYSWYLGKRHPIAETRVPGQIRSLNHAVPEIDVGLV